MYMLMLIPISLREKNWGHTDNNELHPSNIFYVFQYHMRHTN